MGPVVEVTSRQARELAKAAQDTPARRKPAALEALSDFVVVPSQAAIDVAIERRMLFDDLIRTRLADDECPHGRLAGDKTPACGCWPTEPHRGAA